MKPIITKPVDEMDGYELIDELIRRVRAGEIGERISEVRTKLGIIVLQRGAFDGLLKSTMEMI
jgi:hypothetical protein